MGCCFRTKQGLMSKQLLCSNYVPVVCFCYHGWGDVAVHMESMCDVYFYFASFANFSLHLYSSMSSCFWVLPYITEGRFARVRREQSTKIHAVENESDFFPLLCFGCYVGFKMLYFCVRLMLRVRTRQLIHRRDGDTTCSTTYST